MSYNAVNIALNTPPISPRIILVPIVPDQYFWLIGRISAKQLGTCGQSRTITWKLAQSPQSYESRVPKKGSVSVFKHVQNSSRSKPVGRWSSWSSEGLLKVALSRLPSGALFYPLELVYTLCSSLSRIVRNVSQRMDSY